MWNRALRIADEGSKPVHLMGDTIPLGGEWGKGGGGVGAENAQRATMY